MLVPRTDTKRPTKSSPLWSQNGTPTVSRCSKSPTICRAVNCQHPYDLYIPSGPDTWEDMTRDVSCLFDAIGDAAGETCSCAKFKNILTPWGMCYII